MKQFVYSIMACGLALSALAGSPTYISKGPVSGTTLATLLIPPDPNLQIRTVYLQATSDKAASVFSLKSGAAAYAVSANNAAGTTVTVSQTNGLATGDTLMLVSANNANITNCTISSFANSTNIVISLTPSFGTTNGDSVYKMSAATTLPCGAATKVYTGEAVYVAPLGRPLSIIVDGTAAVSVDLVTYRQE